MHFIAFFYVPSSSQDDVARTGYFGFSPVFSYTGSRDLHIILDSFAEFVIFFLPIGKRALQ